MTAAGLALYRGVTWILGLVLPALAHLGPAGSAWRDALGGAADEESSAAGTVWVHAASTGEVGAALVWADALLASGLRPPLLLTTRTRTGLTRARGARPPGRVAARRAPLDLPQLVRARLRAACPARLDIVETELWPNLILEARRAGAAVVFVGATVSERTARRLRAFGLAGPALLGEAVFVLARDEDSAGRFRALGVPEPRVRVTGDLKADAAPSDRPPERVLSESSRPAIVFGSFRPGEEEAALAVAGALDHAAEPGRSVEGGRSAVGSARPPRPVLVVAPRHPEGVTRARDAFRRAGYAVLERGEKERPAEPLDAWILASSLHEGRRVALLATHGELAAAYRSAQAALVGGTFAPFGGHNPLEAAGCGCPVVVGPHHEGIADAVDALVEAGGARRVPDAATAATVLAGWWSDGGFADRSRGATRGITARGGTTARSLEALAAWGLVP